MTKPAIGSLWRRRNNHDFIVKVTAHQYGDIHFTAVDRKPRQPANGKKWAPYWHDAFEPADAPKPKPREVTDADVTNALVGYGYLPRDLKFKPGEDMRRALEAVEKARAS